MIVHPHLKISPALDKLLHRVIYCSKVHLPYYLKQESTQRSTVKEVGLR